ncbi:MAG: Dam family site-specific DNA-(adenine-N6)-methyltransferase [Nitrososphaeria archaeon]|nr:Dam family site-specific DNA-(adenine-N6)-methyltransferase [Nitrosopumilaceae archaeon]NIP10526.1 Dam family site-specific DNA-(adenine-N6)-methyltransferase [Nitrosopumilaceae archaeon]NIP90936.1 Dam family site-specific DNA-(adenine-N6)-methyltransferase [Nitrososphaeria archaeon]NIS94552.1 Dam family site-specific DNA-(adenine-N6)-methyltransferase [Nitrosopumilaceae archaeon]
MKQQINQLLVTPKPFVKWAGGKRQLIPVLSRNLPKQMGTYYEPFLGGGALLFHILSERNQQSCGISDLNSDLILTYTTIRDKIDDLINSLKNHEKQYKKDSKSYYYSIRESSPRSAVEKTSRLIFLNRTCFNGLYRVNSKGKFNVPLGRYTNPNIVNEENLRSVSQILQSSKISIQCRDFESVLKDAKKGDFVYFDPPYQPVSNTANFTSYTHKSFTIDDLERLANLCLNLDSKGCKVMLSNSNSNEVEKMFKERRWNIKKIQANRAINSDSKKRTGHYELLIKNY